jgi:uncharacterized protein YgiM (DUF1202 family)
MSTCGAEPSTSANIVGGVAKGDVVEVLNDLGNGWLSVSINGLHAYISASYVEILPEGAVKQNPKGVVNTNNVNVRAGPSTSDARLTIVSKNTEVEILAEENGWYKVQFGFQIGYIRADLINITSAPSTPSTPEPPSPPETEIPGVVTGSVVNVRSGAGTSYSVIGSVIKGDSVVVLETLNGWYKIRFGSETGYISSNYVSIEPTEPEPEEPEEPEQPEPETPEPETPEPETLAVVTGSVVNVRSGAGTSYSVIGSVRKGESVVVLETLSGWYKIRLKSGQTGYISSNYVSIEPTEPEPEEPEEPKPEMLAVVTGSVVNVRSGAGTSFSVIGSVRKGESVVVLETVSAVVQNPP